MWFDESGDRQNGVHARRTRTSLRICGLRVRHQRRHDVLHSGSPGIQSTALQPGEFPIGGIIYEAEASGLIFRNAKDPYDPWVSCNPAVRTYLTGVGVPGANNLYATGIPNIVIRVVGSKGPFPYLESAWAWSKQNWNITNQWRAGTIKQGQARFAISQQARYVQTAARITTGSANANATFTMSYQ